MSYLVLARKWRPQTFDDLVGQEHIGRTLEKAIASGRVSHAFLFTGTRGVGKTTSARILAMALNCAKEPTAKPCGVCSSCKDIKNGSGLDVLEIDGASNNSVDNVRELRDQLEFVAAGGKHRIIIIDEVHMLSKPAFNALLKTLEEPPSGVIFIFATTDPNKVPETILSRVQRYDFRRISESDIQKRLQYICNEEKLTYDDNALRLLAQKANGSMRDALTLLDRVIPYCDNRISLAELKPVFGLVDAAFYFGIMEKISKKDEAGVLSDVSMALSEGYDLSELISGFEEHVRNLLVSKIDKITPEALAVSESSKEALFKQAEQFNVTDLLRISELLSQLVVRLNRSPLPRLEIEMALIKIVRMDSAVDIVALLRGVPSDIKKKTLIEVSDAPDNVQSALNTEQASSPLPPLNLSSLKNNWKVVIQNLIAENMQVGTCLSYAFVLSAMPEEIRLGLPANQRFQHVMVTKPENIKWLESYFNSRLGFSGRVSLELVEEEKSKAHADASLPQFQKKDIQSAVSQKENINDAIKKEPIIGTILDVFNGEVV